MPLTQIRRLIVAAAGVLLALPAWGAEDGLLPPPPPESPLQPARPEQAARTKDRRRTPKARTRRGR